MESSIFGFVWKYSRRQQIQLLVLTAVSFPFLYLSLELPKTIINEAIGGKSFPRDVLGHPLEQIPYLMLLCGVFLALVFLNGGFKYSINVYKGVVGERMLRRLRYQLFEHVLRFPLPHFRKLSQGEIVSMMNAETEPLGEFVGNAVALPAFQGGTLLTILVFMFVQDPVLGAAAVALYPLQAYLIPKLQRRLNQLKKQRVVQIRSLSERIGEVVSSVQEVHANDTSRLDLADFTTRMEDIYRIRLRIYRLKFFIKFLNNFLAQLTPFFFFSIGGYLVIMGDLTFGALVAVLAAYKDLSAPWKELLNYYQVKEDARIKYEILTESFQPPGMTTSRSQEVEPSDVPALLGEVIGSNLDLREEVEAGPGQARGATFRFDTGRRIAVLGGGGSGKDRLARLLAALELPTSGRLTLAGMNVGDLPETVTGRRIGYVGPEVRLRSGTLRDNLLYPLKRRPLRPADYEGNDLREHETRAREAAFSGNSPHDPNADWIDYEVAGVSGPEDLLERVMEVLGMVELRDEVFAAGLQRTVDPASAPELAARILEARQAMRERLRDPSLAPMVELFDRDSYNTNMTVAENLLFGTPRDPELDITRLPEHPYVHRVLDETGLSLDMVRMGRQVAELMVELFADVPADSELFEQFSFISAEDLPGFRNLLARTEGQDPRSISEEDSARLRALPFMLVPARHRLGLMDDALRARVLHARKVFAERRWGDAPDVEFFDEDSFNPAVSVQDNILFGRLAYGKARAATTVGQVLEEVVDKLALRRPVMDVGLESPVGIGGSRLGRIQRQKLALARVILKRPEILVIDEATSVLDPSSQERIIRRVFDEFRGRGLVWVLHEAGLARAFDHVLVLDRGRVAGQGTYESLDEPGGVLRSLASTA